MQIASQKLTEIQQEVKDMEDALRLKDDMIRELEAAIKDKNNAITSLMSRIVGYDVNKPF